jgi:phasin
MLRRSIKSVMLVSRPANRGPPSRARRKASPYRTIERNCGAAQEEMFMGLDYGIPTEVREFAEKSVEQARKAFEGFSDAAQKAIASVDDAGFPVHAGAKDVGVKALSFAEANVKAAFELAQKLVHAKDPQEFLQLQSEYVRMQMTVIQDQTKELGAAFQKASTKI